MKVNKTYALILAAGLATAGCMESTEERVGKINNALGSQKPRVLTVRLSSDVISSGVEARYYDHDGDMKTVEEYLLTYSSGGAVSGPILGGWKKHLLRPGAKHTVGGMDGLPITRTMTPAEQKELDAAYQALQQYVPLSTMDVGKK
jgi:hypothetical protein